MTKNPYFYAMVAMRTLFLSLIVTFAVMGLWGMALFYGVCFLVSLGMLLSVEDDHYYMVDLLLSLLFIFGMFPTMTGDWVGEKTLSQSFIGFDKVLHTLGGACLALFAAVMARKRVNDRLFFYASIIAFAVAIGAFWEVFEWGFGLLPAQLRIVPTGYADSMLDIIADTVGACVVAIALYWKKYV